SPYTPGHISGVPAGFDKPRRSQSSAAGKSARERIMRDWVGHFAHHEKRLNLSDVLAHLHGELFTAGEGRVRAEMRHELDFDLLAVEIAVEIEEIDLDHRLSRAEGRARTDIACALVAF